MIDIQRKKTWKENATGSPGWGWWRGFLMLECPKGHRARINIGPDGHKVSADGTVSPSLVCPGESAPCDFHEFGRLVGWQGDESAKNELGP